MRNLDKLKETIAKVRASRMFNEFKWVSKPYKGVEVTITDDERIQLAYALDGDVLIMSNDEKALYKAIDAKGGKNLAGLVKGEGSKVVCVNVRNGWQFMHHASGGELPDWHTQMDEAVVDWGIVTEHEDHVVLEAQDSLGIAAWLGSIPIIMLGEGGRSYGPDVTLKGLDVRRPKPEVELPKDPAKAKARIEELIENLYDDDALTRELATRELKKIGEPIIKPLAKHSAETRDPEVKARIEAVLLYLKAYEATPGLIDTMIDRIVVRIQRATEENPAVGLNWSPDSSGMYSMEPQPWALSRLFQGLHGVDLGVLASPEGVRKFAAMMSRDGLTAGVKTAIGLIVLRLDTSAAEEELIKALESKSLHVRFLAVMGLGASTNPKARAKVLEAIGSADLAARRSGFLAAESSTDVALIPKMLELLEAEDEETRFHAAYNLNLLTRGAIDINIFLPDKEVKGAKDAAREWWEKNQGSFRIERAGGR
jgi:hypothetical protein